MKNGRCVVSNTHISGLLCIVPARLMSITLSGTALMFEVDTGAIGVHSPFVEAFRSSLKRTVKVKLDL